MLLSRVADALYWMGRYIERAEHATRLLLVTEDVATEVQGLDEELAQAEWNDLLAVFPGSRLVERAYPTFAPVRPALPQLLLPGGDEPALDVLLPAQGAGERPGGPRGPHRRGVPEPQRHLPHPGGALPARASAIFPAFRDALTATQRGLLATVGAVEHTLTRDHCWLFLKLGEAMERTLRTALILSGKLPALLGAGPQGRCALLHALAQPPARSGLAGELPEALRGPHGARAGHRLHPLRRPRAPGPELRLSRR